MQVKKRDGTLHEVSFDKVTNRLKLLCAQEPKLIVIDPIEIAQKICSQIYNGIPTTKLDELGSEICIANITKHLEYGELASRLIISNNHKLTPNTFSESVELLYNHKDSAGNHVPLVSDELYTIVCTNKELINTTIINNRDYDFDFFSFKTLEKAYLFKINGTLVERIQYLFMRVSLGLHGFNLDSVFETYHAMSQKYFIHATPTLFHSGTARPQLLSCFLLGMEDSVDGIYKTLSDCAKISKWAGGIGVWIHDIRGKKSMIRSTNGSSNGIFPMLRVFNDTARHINQSGKRPGAFAMYLENWHIDILEFIEGKKNHGDEHVRARDLFYALWISDLFMERLKNNQSWTLFCPDETNGLSNYYGDEFKRRYEELEKNPTIKKKEIKAVDLWKRILVSQIETGTPYILYKDAANKKSNQSNIGTIKSSNLCCEIMEYSDHEQYACCTLGSIGLSRFVKDYDYSQIESITMYTLDNCKACTLAKNFINSRNITLHTKNISNITYETEVDALRSRHDVSSISFPQLTIKYTHASESKYVGGLSELLVLFKPSYDFKTLYHITKILTRNLNNVIDINYYPVSETRYSNKLHRPLGIGVQGLADVYCKMRIGFDSPEAIELNKQIFAVIYYSAMEESIQLAKDRNEGMKRIKKLRDTLGITHFIKANEYSSKEKNVFTWKTGGSNIQHGMTPPLPDANTRNDWDELITLETLHKPIDEELQLQEQYIGSYSSFEGSKLSEGKFQFDLWNKEPLDNVEDINLDWDSLREQISQHGVRNSLLLAPMPTASTSQILGNNECIEPYTSNIYYRNTVAGSFIIMNKYLLDDVTKLGLWSQKLKNEIISFNGSIQECTSIPNGLKQIYKTSWDLSQKVLIDQSADRGIYVCQSQSLNLFVSSPTHQKLSNIHMYTWSKGLKTGMYYLRTRAAAKAQQFTIEPKQHEEACEMCSG
jgi:ribonucleoside-diphosphate reductase alpha subunit